jgi:hypothetical protein
MTEGDGSQNVVVNCPLCGDDIFEKVDNTDLCHTCNDVRFYVCDDKEIKYRKYEETLLKAIKELYGKSYNEALHFSMIQQLARCEVMVRHYEWLLGNNKENHPNVGKLLQNERTHLRALYKILQTSLETIVGEKKTIRHELSNDFKTHLKEQLKEATQDAPA